MTKASFADIVPSAQVFRNLFVPEFKYYSMVQCPGK
jgi:hypothetical protein